MRGKSQADFDAAKIGAYSAAHYYKDVLIPKIWSEYRSSTKRTREAIVLMLSDMGDLRAIQLREEAYQARKDHP